MTQKKDTGKTMVREIDFAPGGQEIMNDSAISQVKLVRVGRKSRGRQITSPENGFDFWKQVVARKSWFDLDRETSVALLLDVKSRLRAWNLVSIGSDTNTFLDSKGVFRCAVACSASGVIVMHHHPSGSCKPSKQDILSTRLLVRNGKFLGIPVNDHLIIGDQDFCSLRESGLCDFETPSLRVLAEELAV